MYRRTRHHAHHIKGNTGIINVSLTGTVQWLDSNPAVKDFLHAQDPARTRSVQSPAIDPPPASSYCEGQLRLTTATSGRLQEAEDSSHQAAVEAVSVSSKKIM